MARSRSVLVSTIVVTITALGALSFFPNQGLLDNAHAASVSLSLIGNVNGWNYSQPSGSNPTITVDYGDSVSMAFTTTDVAHAFYIDGYNNTTPDCNQPLVVPYDACSGSIYPGPGVILDFTATYEPGNYTYYCENHPTTMHGIFRVLPAGTDYFLSARSLTMTLRQGSSTRSTITVKSHDNFAGTVTLLANAPPAGLTPSMTPSRVTLSANGTASSILNITASSSITPGMYYQWIDAYNGSTTHSLRMTITITGVPSFSISSNTSSISVIQGTSGGATITVTSQNGFAGRVNITDTLSPQGPSISQTPSSVILNSGSSATSELTVTTSTSTPTGNHTITLTATNSSGQLAKSLQISLKVKVPASTTQTPSAPFFGLSTFTFEIIVAAVTLIGTVAIVVRHRARRKSSRFSAPPCRCRGWLVRAHC